ncbi:hypothetical protein Tco_0112530, partial [Tanacetum coccineum]
MIVQAQEQKKQSKRKQRKDTEDPQLSGPTEPVSDDTESIPTHSNDPLLSCEDRLKLNELMELCTNLSQRVLDLENTKTSQAAEITELKERRRNDNLVFDTSVLDDEEVFAGQDVVKKEISIDEPVTTLGEVVTTANVVVSTAEVTTASATTTVDELTLAQTLTEIKAAKPKAVTTDATTTTTAVIRPKARGVIVQEPSKFTTTTSPSQSSQLP